MAAKLAIENPAGNRPDSRGKFCICVAFFARRRNFETAGNTCAFNEMSGGSFGNAVRRIRALRRDVLESLQLHGCEIFSADWQ